MLLRLCCPACAYLGGLESRSILVWRLDYGCKGPPAQVRFRQHVGEICGMRPGGLACTSLCLSGLPWLAAHNLALQSRQPRQALTVCEASPGLAPFPALVRACRGFVSSSSSLEVTAATVCTLACWDLEVSASWAA